MFSRVTKVITNNITKISWLVLISAILISIFTRIPFGFFDEQVHYVRALGIANGQLLSYPVNGDDSKLGHTIDTGSIEYINRYLGIKDNIVALGWLKEAAKRSGQDEFIINTSAAPYTPVPYLPYAAASVIAKTIALDVKSEFIAMRIFGAATSLLIVLAAFRLAPRKFKWSILVIALVPMSIASFSGISADGFTIAIALLYMATFLRMTHKIQNDKLSHKDIALLAASSVMLVVAKVPIFLMIALILCTMLIFWKKIMPIHKIMLSGVICFTAAITLAWAVYAKDINTGAYWGRNVDTVAQLNFIADHPLVFIKNISYSFLNYDFTGVTYNLYAESEFYGTLPFAIDIIILLGLALSAFIFKDTRHKHVTTDEVWIYRSQLMLFVLSSIAIFVLLYLQFTTIGTLNRIEGVQPRYFLPLLPLLIMNPYRMNLSKNVILFAYSAPFVGVMVYLMLIAMQLG